MPAFNGSPFRFDGDEIPSYSSRAQYRVFRIPGGNQTIIQRNPTSIHTLETEAECTFAEVEALRAEVGHVGTLDFFTTQETAMLLSLTPKKVYNNDTYLVSLSFKILFDGDYLHRGTGATP